MPAGDAAKPRHALFVIGILLALATAASAVAVLSSCGGEDTVTSLDGYWEVASSRDVPAYYLFRITWTEAGYTIEPASCNGIRWKTGTWAEGALQADGIGPAGERYVVRFERLEGADKTTLVVTPATGGAPVLRAELRRPGGHEGFVDQAFATELDEWRTSMVKEGVDAIEAGVKRWMADHGGKAPPAGAVWPYGALGDYVDPWPENPYTGKVMLPGETRGDYAYGIVGSGRAYWLKGYLPGGRTYIVP